MTERIATSSQTVGPFFHFALTTNASLGCLVRAGTGGVRVTLRVRVLDGAGAVVPDAMVEIDQADAHGTYPTVPAPGNPEPAFCGWGRLETSADGLAEFQTVRPGPVSDGEGGVQAPHVNVCLFARGILRHLYTRIYFAGDPTLGSDPGPSAVPQERRDTLLAHNAPESPSVWEITLRMQGEGETVFFDL